MPVPRRNPNRNAPIMRKAFMGEKELNKVRSTKQGAFMWGIAHDYFWTAEAGKSMRFMHDLGAKNLSTLLKSNQAMDSFVTDFKPQGKFAKPSDLVKAIGINTTAKIITFVPPKKMMAFANKYGYIEFIKLVKTQGVHQVGKILLAT